MAGRAAVAIRGYTGAHVEYMYTYSSRCVQHFASPRGPSLWGPSRGPAAAPRPACTRPQTPYHNPASYSKNAKGSASASRVSCELRTRLQATLLLAKTLFIRAYFVINRTLRHTRCCAQCWHKCCSSVAGKTRGHNRDR